MIKKAAAKQLRFWHQSMTELEGLGIYRRFLMSHAIEILGEEATLQVEGLRSGSYHGRAPTAALENAFVYHRILDQVIDNAIKAERQGYDAYVIGSFSEPYLREIRSAVRIPVVSILETSILVACSLGKKIIPIANAPQIAFMVQTAVDKHGLKERIMPAVALEPPLQEPALADAFDHPTLALQSFAHAAEQAIRSGAEVVIPAEGVLATLISANKMTAIAGAPVMDVFAVTWRYAVMLVRLRHSCGLQVSGIGHYAQGDPGLIDLLTAGET
jgi:allantoin racemase